MSNNEQKLVDLMYEVAIILSKQSRDFTISYVTKTLSDNGFKTIPMGCCHGKLVSEKILNKLEDIINE